MAHGQGPHEAGPCVHGPGRLRGTWFPYKGSYAYEVSIVGFVSF